MAKNTTRTIGTVTVTTATAAAVTTLAVWGASLAGVDVPTEVQGALTTLIVFIAGWLVPGTAANTEVTEVEAEHAGGDDEKVDDDE